MVRLGNGSPSQNLRGESGPATIDPFIINFKIDGEDNEVSLNEEGELTIDGVVIGVGESELEINTCVDLSDKFLRTNYWYYLRGAVLA